MDNEVADLLQRFVAGDQAAFAELVKRYRRKLYQVAYQIVRNHLDADEVVQETFVRLYRKQKELTDVKTVTSFLIRIASNYAIDLLRRRRHHRQLDPDPGTGSSPAQLQSTKGVRTPGDDYHDKEITREVTAALSTLPPRQRLTILLHDVEGYTKAEVAAIMECPEATVRSNLHIARAKVKKLLLRRFR